MTSSANSESVTYAKAFGVKTAAEPVTALTTLNCRWLFCRWPPPSAMPKC